MSSPAVFREATDDNLREIVRMSDTLTPSQQRCVAPNAVSVAQGLWTGAWFRAIYDHKTAAATRFRQNDPGHVGRVLAYLWLRPTLLPGGTPDRPDNRLDR